MTGEKNQNYRWEVIGLGWWGGKNRHREFQMSCLRRRGLGELSRKDSEKAEQWKTSKM